MCPSFVDPTHWKSNPSRPQVDNRSAPNRPRSPPQVDPESTPSQTQVAPQTGRRSIQIAPKLAPSRSRTTQERVLLEAKSTPELPQNDPRATERAKSTPSRPQAGHKSATDRPQIDPADPPPDRPQVDPTPLPTRPQIDPTPTSDVLSRDLRCRPLRLAATPSVARDYRPPLVRLQARPARTNRPGSNTACHATVIQADLMSQQERLGRSRQRVNIILLWRAVHPPSGCSIAQSAYAGRTGP